MKPIFKAFFKKTLTVLVLALMATPAFAADDDFTDYEAEAMDLVNFRIDTIPEAFGKALVTSTSDISTLTMPFGNSSLYDIQVTYSSTSGNSALEIYIDDVLIDIWMADENTGTYTNDTLNRVAHITQNVKITGPIELIAYTDNGESISIDKIGLRKTTIADKACNMVWGSGNAISSLILGNTERISAGSGVHMNEFTGSKIQTVTQVVEDITNQVCIFTDEYGYAKMKYRIERYDYHVRVKMVGLESMPKHDKSLCPVLSLPCGSGVGYQILDSNMSASTSGNDITLYWSSMADRDLVPGGYIALYAKDQENEALSEITTLDALEPPFVSKPPTDIALTPAEIMENNSIYDVVGVVTATDPDGDEAYYTLTSGDGDDDNGKFVLVLDTVKALEVFNYDTDSLYSIRLKVTDSQQNTYSKAFTIKILKDQNSSLNDAFANNSINIFPNPADAVLHIATREQCSIQIVSIEGRTMYAGSHNGVESIVDIKSFPEGLYFVRLFNDKEQVIQKIVKE